LLLTHSRNCIVTRRILPVDEMIRFVAGPDRQVVPDLAQKLPGRGVWTAARCQTVELAVSGNLFARGLKMDIHPSPKLAQEVDALLDRAALGALSMCKKAGVVVSGFNQVENCVRNGKAIMMLHALEAAPDGIRKLSQAVYAVQNSKNVEIAIKQIWTISQLDLALGGHNVVHAAAMSSGAARNLVKRIEKLERYRC
jgi:uncharacterized protein